MIVELKSVRASLCCLLIALLIAASYVVSIKASARIVVVLSSDFVRRGLNKSSSVMIIIMFKLAESLTMAQTIAEHHPTHTHTHKTHTVF